MKTQITNPILQRNIEQHGISNYKNILKVNLNQYLKVVNSKIEYRFYHKDDTLKSLSKAAKSKGDKNIIIEKISKNEYPINKILESLDTLKEDTYKNGFFINYEKGPLLGSLHDDRCSDIFDEQIEDDDYYDNQNIYYDPDEDNFFVDDLHDQTKRYTKQPVDYSWDKLVNSRDCKWESISEQRAFQWEDLIKTFDEGEEKISGFYEIEDINKGLYNTLSLLINKFPNSDTFEILCRALQKHKLFYLLHKSQKSLSSVDLEILKCCEYYLENKSFSRNKHETLYTREKNENQNHLESKIHITVSKIESLLIEFSETFEICNTNEFRTTFKRFDLYERLKTKFNIIYANIPGYESIDILYRIWNLIKHSTESTYIKLNQYPKYISKKFNFNEHLYGIEYVEIDEVSLIKLIDGVRLFLEELYIKISNIENKEHTWCYQMYFLNYLKEQK